MWYEKYSGVPLCFRVLDVLKTSINGRSIKQITNEITNEITNKYTDSLAKNEKRNLYDRVRKSLQILEKADKVKFVEELTPKRTVAKIYTTK